MTANEKPAYWAVLPASVRYDPDLPSTAKLLYAELSALANFTGFCYAGNAYLAELYGVDVRTVQRLLTKLCERGFITVFVNRDPQNNAVIGCKIYCGVNPLSAANVPASGAPPHDKNVTQNNININNIPPIVPLEGDAKKRKRKETIPWKQERFDGFWAFYPRKTNKQAAVRAWDKLQPSDELIAEIAAALILLKESSGWADRKYIPHASTFLNGRRWEDVADLSVAQQRCDQPGAWAEDPEVI